MGRLAGCFLLVVFVSVWFSLCFFLPVFKLCFHVFQTARWLFSGRLKTDSVEGVSGNVSWLLFLAVFVS